MSVKEPLICGRQVPAELLLREVHVLDPRARIDARRDLRVRGGQIAELGEPGSLGESESLVERAIGLKLADCLRVASLAAGGQVELLPDLTPELVGPRLADALTATCPETDHVMASAFGFGPGRV